MSARGSACERVADLEAALLAADEELGHQMRRVSALEQECCRVVSQLRGALRSAASSERGRLAAEARAGASEAETTALRQRLDVLRRRQGQLEGGTESSIAQRRPSFTAVGQTSFPRPERTSFSTPSSSLLLRDTMQYSTLHQSRPPTRLIPEDASLRPRPPFGAGDDLISGPRSPIGGVVSNEIRLRRLVLRLEQQLSTERAVHAEQLGQLVRRCNLPYSLSARRPIPRCSSCSIPTTQTGIRWRQRTNASGES